MTPQERQLIDDLFDRLSKLEDAPRDRDAEAAIMEGLRRAPNGTYALVQTVLVQDEALKRANARIQELEGHGPEQQQSGGFLDSMRDAIFGQGQSQAQPQDQPPRGSVPNAGNRPVWNTGQTLPPGYGQAPGYGQPYGAPQPPPVPGGGGGGSFLGTAAAAAAGVVGGSLLLSSIRGMMGGGHQSFGDTASHSGGIEDRRPWGDQSGGNLAKDAGINDIGSSGRGSGDRDYGSRQGMYDEQASNENYDDDNEDDDDQDSDGFDSDGDSDYA
ncbi:MAG TPA: DUF2076 domain-containing protein [Bradyrhizobium sp.]|nr:DUF2076 domain-containing protein [Bradyrhizobium sp.]